MIQNTELTARIEAALSPALAALNATLGPITRTHLYSEGARLEVTLGARGSHWDVRLTDIENGTWLIGEAGYAPSLQAALDRLEAQLAEGKEPALLD